MGKTEKGTPKDIANRMKAKGLQKLRWYCQMCQKQCRDENGFKCHTTSESHQRQLLLFAEDPDKYLDSFSEEFMEGYMSLLKRRFGTKRVHANNVYQEYIHDRDHVHMNATQWETLTEFVKWLGREGHCIVDETEKGWFVAYIDRDPETLLKQEKQKKKERFERDEEERFQEFIHRQVERGRAKEAKKDRPEGEGGAPPTSVELRREGEEGITLEMKLQKKVIENRSAKVDLKVNPLKVKKEEKPRKESSTATAPKKKNVLEEIIEEDMRRQKRRHPDRDTAESASASASFTKKVAPAEPPWLIKNIVVKVITKDLGSKFYKAKGVVKEVVNKYAAIVKLFDKEATIKLDQTHLETVVPSLERQVLILRGKYKGCRAILKKLEVDNFCATLQLISEPYEGKRIEEIAYEDFSKLNS